MTIDVQTALANEARRQELKLKDARLTGGIEATAVLMQRLATLNNDQQLQQDQVRATLAAFEVGAGPGITADFGSKSSVTQLLEAERAAATLAVVLLCKDQPACSEAEAVDVWRAAALASHPALAVVLQEPLPLAALYRANLMAAQTIAEDTWAALRDWIVATPTAAILAM